MKLLKIRWLLLIVVTGAGMAGVISSNVGCGDSNEGTGTAGTGGGSGGSTGSGGSGGSKPVKLQYTFDTATSSDSKTWMLNDYIDGTPAKNLGAFSKPDAGLNLADPPSMEWSSSDSEGSSSSGSMKISVTFTEYGQYVDPVINLSGPMDLSGSIVSMKVRLVSGSFTGGLQFHISTGDSWLYWAGTWMNGSDLTAGAWKQTSIDTSIPPTGNDPAMVRQVGIQFAAGAAPDGGGTPPSGRLVFEIDTVQAR